MKELFNQVKAFVFDVDGVFTDGQVYLLPGEDFIRAVNIKDGYAIQYCIKMGYKVCIITGGVTREINARFVRLGVTDIYMGSSNKLEKFEAFRGKYGFNYNDMLYMGDDLPDYPVMEKVGVPVCPSDAAAEVKQVARYVSPLPGGKGCVRDVIEKVLTVQGKWFTKDAFEW